MTGCFIPIAPPPSYPVRQSGTLLQRIYSSMKRTETEPRLWSRRLSHQLRDWGQHSLNWPPMWPPWGLVLEHLDPNWRVMNWIDAEIYWRTCQERWDQSEMRFKTRVPWTEIVLLEVSCWLTSVRPPGALLLEVKIIFHQNPGGQFLIEVVSEKLTGERNFH